LRKLKIIDKRTTIHTSTNKSHKDHWTVKPQTCEYIDTVLRHYLQTKTRFQDEVFRVVTPCSVTISYQRFRGSCCLHLQGEVKMRQHVPLKRLYSTHNTEDLDLKHHHCKSLKTRKNWVSFDYSTGVGENKTGKFLFINLLSRMNESRQPVITTNYKTRTKNKETLKIGF
jgi:hypothetical protein